MYANFFFFIAQFSCVFFSFILLIFCVCYCYRSHFKCPFVSNIWIWGIQAKKISDTQKPKKKEMKNNKIGGWWRLKLERHENKIYISFSSLAEEVKKKEQEQKNRSSIWYAIKYVRHIFRHNNSIHACVVVADASGSAIAAATVTITVVTKCVCVCTFCVENRCCC